MDFIAGDMSQTFCKSTEPHIRSLLTPRSPAFYLSAVLQPPSSPPGAVQTIRFRFPALAALAGQLPVGAGREAALAALLSARMAAGAALPSPLPAALREVRAAAARHWLQGSCPDAKVRAACSALAEATAGDAPEGVASALARVMEVTAPNLDTAARLEFGTLIAVFRG
jgi:hypothetical protein